MGARRGPSLTLRIAGETHIGRVRSTNEDRLVLEPQLHLYAVLDGMGGENAGDVAAQLAGDTIREFVRGHAGQLAPVALLQAALAAGSAAVFSVAQDRLEYRRMGTTAVACLVVEPATLAIAHAGDSRAYLLRDGQLRQLTRDHTVAEEWIERGWWRAEDVDRHFGKHTLSRNLGMLPSVWPDTTALDCLPGDRVLLCSDGLHGMASADTIRRVLDASAENSPERIAHELIEQALRAGGGDNASAIVIVADQP